MPEISFPSVPLQEFSIQVIVPNVIRHSSIYAAKEQIHARGTMRFAGSISWARRSIMDREAEIAEIEAFVAGCYGPVNTFDVPIPYDQSDRMTSAADLTISGLMSTAFQSTFAATKGLREGDYFNVGTRLHKITAVAMDTKYTAVPALPSDATTIAWATPKLRARLAQDSADSPRAGPWAGPWRLSVTEAL